MEAFPSPIIYPIRDSEDTGNRIFVCRDDLLPQGLGGNKVRIAQEYVSDMFRHECNCMVAYGNARSNLCRVLASMCCARNIPCYVICSRESYEQAHAETANSRMMRLLGAEMVECEKDSISSAVLSLLSRLKKQGLKPYYIFGNELGRGNEGVPAMAYAKAYAGIVTAAGEDGEEPEMIFHASGTGATQAGLICGHLLRGDQTSVYGILISSRTQKRAISIIREGIVSCMSLLGADLPDTCNDEIRLLCNYTAGGYGLYHEEILSCIRTQLRENALPLDPVYTGKAFWGMTQYLKENRISGKKILFLHTGGTPLFYDTLLSGSLDQEKR